MAEFSSLELLKIERLLNMGTGYVLDFSNRTFRDFMYEHADVDIFGEDYNYRSGSKANRLRSFFEQHDEYLAGAVLEQLIEHWRTGYLLRGREMSPTDIALGEECMRVAKRLKDALPIANVSHLKPNSSERGFDRLAKSIRQSIEQNEPEMALDRLHTFMSKYIRNLCEKNNIECPRGKPLHSMFGEYANLLREEGVIESKMTARILKSTGSALDAFNDVRNNRSLAHDNPILNREESILIFNQVLSSIRFLNNLAENEGLLPSGEA